LGVHNGRVDAGLGIRAEADYGRWWLALGGVVSIIFGVLLAISPLIGAPVLTCGSAPTLALA
jgi:uncharacterized membrane protein HdeD (DUF308 family)